MAADGRLEGVSVRKTPGGHARYDRDDIVALASRISAADGDAAPLPAPAPAPDGADNTQTATLDPTSAPAPAHQYLQLPRITFRRRHWVLLAVAALWLIGTWAITAVSWSDVPSDDQIYRDKRMSADMKLFMGIQDVFGARTSTECLSYMRTLEGTRAFLQGELIVNGEVLLPRSAKGKKISAAVKQYMHARRDFSPDFPVMGQTEFWWNEFLSAPVGYTAPLARHHARERWTDTALILAADVNEWEQDEAWAGDNKDACANMPTAPV